MYFLYSLLLTIGFLILLPRFAVDALRSRKYVTGLRQRLGNLPKLPRPDRPLIWLHCVSVGETEAARPLVRRLRDRFPAYNLVISTTTVAGQQVARQAFAKEAAAVFYFPIDWTWVVRRVLLSLKPNALLIMETELWPNLLQQCHQRSIPVALINGRLSPKSFGRYRRIRPFMRRVLKNIQIAIMQSDQDAARIRDLGMPVDRIVVGGNLKFDSSATTESDAVVAQAIRERFSLNGNSRLIVAASTHWPEENIVIEAFKRTRKLDDGSRVRLLIAPRHPARFEEVAVSIAASGLQYARRSAQQTEADRDCDVVLLDSLGELRAALALADIAFIGGSISSHGGHNMLEPAAQGVCVITGPHTQNFAAITKALLAEGALVQLPEVARAEASARLTAVFDELLRDEFRRKQIGERALTVCQRNRGATENAIEIIASLLEPRDAIDKLVSLPAVHAAATK